MLDMQSASAGGGRPRRSQVRISNLSFLENMTFFVSFLINHSTLLGTLSTVTICAFDVIIASSSVADVALSTLLTSVTTKESLKEK